MHVRSRDALYKEYSELTEQLSGISPKLQLHAKLKARLQEIKHELGDNTSPVENLVRGVVVDRISPKRPSDDSRTRRQNEYAVREYATDPIPVPSERRLERVHKARNNKLPRVPVRITQK
jgi:hypothetical protein